MNTFFCCVRHWSAPHVFIRISGYKLIHQQNLLPSSSPARKHKKCGSTACAIRRQDQVALVSVILDIGFSYLALVSHQFCHGGPVAMILVSLVQATSIVFNLFIFLLLLTYPLTHFLITHLSSSCLDQLSVLHVCAQPILAKPSLSTHLLILCPKGCFLSYILIPHVSFLSPLFET